MDIYYTAEDRTPYTYLIGWTKHNRWYYGVRFAKGCHPTDLWVKYFTSSKYVQTFREECGEPDVIEIRKIFYDRDSAIRWERGVLLKMRIVELEHFLNKANCVGIDPILCGHARGKTYEEIYGVEKAKELREHRRKTSSAREPHKWTEEQRARIEHAGDKNPNSKPKSFVVFGVRYDFTTQKAGVEFIAEKTNHPKSMVISAIHQKRRGANTSKQKASKFLYSSFHECIDVG